MYRVFVTSVPYATELVTQMCKGRADCKNRIKELKEDLSLDIFCLQSFDATDAAFRTGCVLYTFLMGFQETRCSCRANLNDSCGSCGARSSWLGLTRRSLDQYGMAPPFPRTASPDCP